MINTAIIGRARENPPGGFAMGQAGEGTPIVLVRGLSAPGDGRAADLVRPRALDLFL